MPSVNIPDKNNDIEVRPLWGILNYESTNINVSSTPLLHLNYLKDKND